MGNRIILSLGESLKLNLELGENIKSRVMVWIVYQLVESEERKMIELKYNKEQNCYETVLTINDEWEHGEWNVEYVYISDIYGEPLKIYNAFLYPEQSRKRYFDKESFIVWEDDLDAALVRTIWGWIYLRSDGTVDKQFVGMVNNQFGWWYVSNGVIDYSFTGMAKNQFGWWFIRNGNLDCTYTGIAKNEYGYWYMINGFLSANYNGTIEYEGKEYIVKDGKVCDFAQ